MDLLINKDLNKICRICLSLSDEMLSIYHSINTKYCKDIQIYQIIQKYCTMQISPEDMFSKLICNECVKEATNGFLFKLKCENSQDILMKYQNDLFLNEETRQISVKEELEEDHKYEDIDEIFDKVEVELLPTVSKSEQVEISLNTNIKSEEISVNNGLILPKKVKNKPENKRKYKKRENSAKKSEKKVKLTKSENCKKKVKSPSNTALKKLFACDICNQYCTTNKGHLYQHKLKHEGVILYKCKHCDFTSNDKSNFKRHSYIHDNLKPFACQFCSYRSNRIDSVRDHTRTHTEDRPYLCDQCHYTCKTSTGLRTHKRNKHSEEKKFICNVCSFKCKSRSSIVLHLKTHGTEKRFVCEECSYSSHTLAGLQNHTRAVHTGERPFKCNQCSYSGTSSGSLKVHLRKHFGVKNFKCSECGLCFYTAYRLKVHTNIHTGLKPYSCGICEFKSATSSSLRRHQRKIHNMTKDNKVNLIK